LQYIFYVGHENRYFHRLKRSEEDESMVSASPCPPIYSQMSQFSGPIFLESNHRRIFRVLIYIHNDTKNLKPLMFPLETPCLVNHVLNPHLSSFCTYVSW
jgi:hypothetical protein